MRGHGRRQRGQPHCRSGRLRGRFGPVRGLVNSAGIGCDIPFFDSSVEQFRKVLDINLTGTFTVAPGQRYRSGTDRDAAGPGVADRQDARRMDQ